VLFETETFNLLFLSLTKKGHIRSPERREINPFTASCENAMTLCQAFQRLAPTL
jgi:hypothetical protein